jgi:hypothetical protein
MLKDAIAADLQPRAFQRVWISNLVIKQYGCSDCMGQPLVLKGNLSISPSFKEACKDQAIWLRAMGHQAGPSAPPTADNGDQIDGFGAHKSDVLFDKCIKVTSTMCLPSSAMVPILQRCLPLSQFKRSAPSCCVPSDPPCSLRFHCSPIQCWNQIKIEI